MSQSLSGYVREHLATFERLLRSGSKYHALLDALVAAGFEKASYTALDSALYRARRSASAPAKSLASERAHSFKLLNSPEPFAKRITLRPTTQLKAEDLI